MADWNYTFDAISKANWLKQIESDLQPRDVSSIQSEWWPGEKIIATQHSDDKQKTIRLPDQLFEQPPRIMEWLDTTSDEAKTINRKILDALNYGAQSLVLHVDTNKKMPFRLWLDGVHSDMIELSVSLNLELPEVINAVREIIPRSALIRLNRKPNDQSSPVFLDAIQGSTDENPKSYRFIYRINSAGHWTIQTSALFQSIVDDLTYWKAQGLNQIDYLENCILLLIPDSNYLKQLIQTRVLHLVWNNLWKYFVKNQEISSSSYMECHIHPENTIDPDKYLIRSTSSALAASLTGVHSLCIHHPETLNHPPHYDRADRNIHHLLNMESEMYIGTDPLAGSISLDYYTQRWTEDIWTRLQF